MGVEDYVYGGKVNDLLHAYFSDNTLGGYGANSMDVFAGDALDVVCNGGFVQSDPGAGVTPLPVRHRRENGDVGLPRLRRPTGARSETSGVSPPRINDRPADALRPGHRDTQRQNRLPGRWAPSTPTRATR
jgi:hypothetical protein